MMINLGGTRIPIDRPYVTLPTGERYEPARLGARGRHDRRPESHRLYRTQREATEARMGPEDLEEHTR